MGPVTANVRRIWPWAVLVIAWYAFAAMRPWLEPDEGRYAEVPREMLATGDWITPHLDGFVYLEKPPLQYWATAAAYSVLGVNEFSSRLFGVTLALLAIPLVYVLAARQFRSEPAGQAAAVVLAASPYFLLVGQLNLLDGAFATLLCAGVGAFIAAQQAPDDGRARWLMALAWAVLAAAVLQKGIVVFVLCGATLAAYSALTRDVSVWRRLHLPTGIALMALIAGGWFVAVARRNPDFLQFFFVHEHFERFLTTIHQRVEPWWFFIPCILLAIAPWLGQLPESLRQAWSQVPDRGFRPALFALLWCIVVLTFFSASGSKLAPYVMPAVPFLAVVLAPCIATRAGAMTRAAQVTGLLLILTAGAMLVLIYRRSTMRAVPGEALLWCVVAVLAGVAALVAALRRDAGERFAWQAVVASAALGWPSLLMAYAVTPPLRTSHALADMLQQHIGPATALYSVGQYRQTLPPYLGRTLRVADYQGELEFAFGHQRSQSPPLPTLAAFEQAWAAESDAVAFVSHRDYAKLEARNLMRRVIAVDDESVVIARR
jgi:4-amino-4-deoxy-L-arabinose transferase-like glycosyltransferase